MNKDYLIGSNELADIELLQAETINRAYRVVNRKGDWMCTVEVKQPEVLSGLSEHALNLFEDKYEHAFHGHFVKQ